MALLAAKIGVELSDNEIDWIERVGPKRPPPEINQSKPEQKLPRPVVVRLQRRNKRDLTLKAAKTRRNLTTTDLELNGPDLKVFFNERLTKENRNLFRAALNPKNWASHNVSSVMAPSISGNLMGNQERTSRALMTSKFIMAMTDIGEDLD
ncbi:unnamed protein product [Arctia plantaginis]|uniref:Uncharacterized protein n=1 Tax=Arctia plantaginis TaxID=874455 RepID=A0A8S1AFC1_ARCPL|nr:unnamed protein product [Arctia plantaginis]